MINSITNGITGDWLVADECVSVEFNRVIGVSTTGVAAGLTFFTVKNDCDTVFLNDCEGVGPFGDHGYVFSNPTGASGPRLVRALNCFGELATNEGFVVSGGRDIHLQGCHAAVNSGMGFLQSGGTSITYLDCIALQNVEHGFHVTGGTYVTLSACKGSDNSSAVANTWDGLRIASDTTNVTVTGGCRFADYIFASAKQRYGISVGDVGTDYINIDETNTLSGVSGGLGNFSPGLNNRIYKAADGFTGTLTGCTTSPTGTVSFSLLGRQIVLNIPDLTATSNTTGCTITGGPERMRPIAARTAQCVVVENGVKTFGTAVIAPSGTIELFTGAASGAFTASGTKGSAACTITYTMS
jgi:hypothetical protein